jgi:ABC-type antimicrobial peptide transport system permease subunit
MAMHHAIDLATAEIKARAYLLIAVAIVSLPLVLLGVAGTLSYVTRQHIHDIAVTLAIGATPGDIRARIIRQALGAAVVALVVGLGMGVAGGRIISGVLYQVGAVNVAALVASGSLILVLVALSSALPARRAGSINPATVLRGG